MKTYASSDWFRQSRAHELIPNISFTEHENSVLLLCKELLFADHYDVYQRAKDLEILYDVTLFGTDDRIRDMVSNTMRNIEKHNKKNKFISYYTDFQ